MDIEQLRRKYASPMRAIEATGADLDCEYCVGGALCLETGVGVHFPKDEQIVEALARATNNRVVCYKMADHWHEKFHDKVAELVASNDIGNFDAAWKVLTQLLNWKHFAKTQQTGKAG